MRLKSAFGLCIAVSGCAFPKHVERFGVEYNDALAGMNNEQTLLNILRARDGMPTHFTSVTTFRGNIGLTASVSANGQLRGEGLTEALASGFSNTTATTNSTTTTVPAGGGAPGVATIVSTVTTPVASGSATSTLAEGVDVWTPQVTGQIVSGTTFDVNVFDTQKFYQGITSSIPFSTVEALLAQGFENRMLAALTIARVEFRLASDEFAPKGTLILRYINDPRDPAEARRFAQFVNCYELGSDKVESKQTELVAISRLTRGPDGKSIPLALDKVVLIDGEKIGVSKVIGDDPTDDSGIFLTRITPAKRAPRLTPRSAAQCAFAGYSARTVTVHGQPIEVVVPNAPVEDPIYLGGGVALRLGVKNVGIPVKVDVDVTFRSPEGLFRYLGVYLSGDGARTIPLGGEALFSVGPGRSPTALATARYRGQTYALVNNPKTGTRNAQVFTLLQQLINLHKEASDRPTVIPVRTIP